MYEPATPSPQGTRYCTNCLQSRDSIGGYWKSHDNGKRRRWLCATCAAKRKLR